MEASSAADTLSRTETGQFLAGVSGNPAGRPKGARSKAFELQHRLEAAVREHIPVERVYRIIDKLCELAESGDKKAAKIILDKLVPDAAHGSDDEAEAGGKTVVFRIENATFAAASRPMASPIVIDNPPEVTKADGKE